MAQDETGKPHATPPTRKSQANAGQKRKARAPTISVDGLANARDAFEDRELFELASYLEFLEELRKDRSLNTPFIALEAINALAGALVSGRSEANLKTAWPKEWGNETITIPLDLALALGEVWQNYRSAPSGTTLGEAFAIEGGGQGNPPMKSRLATVVRDRFLAREVELNYLSENFENSVRLEDVLHRVAEENGLSFKTVKAAHLVHRDAIRSGLRDLEILKGAKTSRS